MCMFRAGSAGVFSFLHKVFDISGYTFANYVFNKFSTVSASLVAFSDKWQISQTKFLHLLLLDKWSN